MRDWVEDFGVVAPVVFIAMSSCLTVMLFPGPLLAGASGLLFGTALGFPISLISATLGASMAFALARFVAHDAVEELSGRRLKRLQEWIERRGFYAVFYARLAPGVPYNLVNYAAGLSRVRYRAFVAATALGASPRAFAYTALGGSLDDLGSPEAIAAFSVLVVMAVVGGFFAWRTGLRERRAPTQGDRTAGAAGS